MFNNVLEQFCVDALLDFYNKGNVSFADYLDDNFVWYGPMTGQKIQGKENFVNAFSKVKNKLRFNIENLHTKLIPLKAEVFLLIATYELYTYYPDGKVVRYDQHMIIVSRRKKVNGEYQWKSPLIHVSDVLYGKVGAKNHPLVSGTADQSLADLFGNRVNVKKLVFSGKNNSNYYIAEDSIRYIEGGKGVRSYIHTKDGVYIVNHILKDVAEKLPDYYYRCHSSYIVNLRCITKISNYKIFLDGGEEIPVPVKRYSQVRNEIKSLIEKL